MYLDRYWRTHKRVLTKSFTGSDQIVYRYWRNHIPALSKSYTGISKIIYQYWQKRIRALTKSYTGSQIILIKSYIRTLEFGNAYIWIMNILQSFWNCIPVLTKSYISIVYWYWQNRIRVLAKSYTYLYWWNRIPRKRVVDLANTGRRFGQYQ